MNITQIKSCCFTGYRPEKFPFSLNRSDSDYIKFENRLLLALTNLIGEGCYDFYCGAARGFDLIAAELVLLLRRRRPEIRLICAVPFDKQADRWSEYWHNMYEKVIKSADEVVFVSNQYHPGVYEKRNRHMVDNSQVVLTYYDGKPGGTASTIKYAQKAGLRVVNLADKGFSQISLDCPVIYEIISD